jgi:hypothetical protein
VTYEYQAIVLEIGFRGPFGHQAGANRSLESRFDTIAWCSEVTFLLCSDIWNFNDNN